MLCQPEMALQASDAKSLTFNLDASCCTIDTKKESHMHAVTISFVGPNTISTRCKAMIDGKEVPEQRDGAEAGEGGNGCA